MEDEKKKESGAPWWVWVLVGVLGLGIVSAAFGDDDASETAGEAEEQQEVSAEVDDDSASQEAAPDDADMAEEPEPVTEEADAEPTAVAGIGDSVTQEEFVFTVNSMECGISRVGSELLGEEAQGQYCKISVSVENTGNQAEYFSADSQVVYDDQGREFEADTGAMIYLDEGDDVWLGDDINPGNAIEAGLLFDLPEGVEPATIALKEGIFGSPVEVSLK